MPLKRPSQPATVYSEGTQAGASGWANIRAMFASQCRSFRVSLDDTGLLVDGSSLAVVYTFTVYILCPPVLVSQTTDVGKQLQENATSSSPTQLGLCPHRIQSPKNDLVSFFMERHTTQACLVCSTVVLLGDGEGVVRDELWLILSFD